MSFVKEKGVNRMGLYRYSVSLRLRHPNIDPAEISRTLGMQSNGSWRAGEQRRTPKGNPLNGVRSETYWYADIVEGESITKRLVSALHEALDKLELHESFLKRIRDEGGRAEFFVGWYIKSQAGEDFDQSLLSRLTKLQIDLALDNYHDPDLPDEE